MPRFPAQPSDTPIPLPNKKHAFFINSGLLAAAVLLFALPQPNPLSLNGFPFLAWFAFIPLFILIRRISFRSSFLWGAVYGALCYCVYTHWLLVFHPLAMYIIASLYFFYLMLAVPALKLADMLFPKRGFIVQWIVWVGYEYLKTLGFNGYSYGVIGYSQWSWPVIIRIASIFGVWGVSALIVFPSAWLAGAFNHSVSVHTGKHPMVKKLLSGFPAFFCNHRISAVVWALALVFTLVWGVWIAPRDYSQDPSVTVALIQPNSDPWMGGHNTYVRDFQTLKRLSNEALASHPEISFVVWPETAFIPRIDWHYRYREDRLSYDLVVELLEYIDTAPVPFVIGNDDAVRERNELGILDRVDYNAVFLFRPGVNVIPPEPERYRKMHLVPFTEHFPYRRLFPWIYNLLIEFDTHFWKKGTEATVFEVDGLHFSSPVCFEDTFGYISRRFVRNGARAIVNLTNDAWANSASCQYQHLAMAVFRTVENGVPLVRSTASGQTAFVDPNGIVTAMAPSFEQAWLTGTIPLIRNWRPTLYVLWGDILGQGMAVAGFLLLIWGLLTKLRKEGKINIWTPERRF